MGIKEGTVKLNIEAFIKNVERELDADISYGARTTDSCIETLAKSLDSYAKQLREILAKNKLATKNSERFLYDHTLSFLVSEVTNSSERVHDLEIGHSSKSHALEVMNHLAPLD